MFGLDGGAFNPLGNYKTALYAIAIVEAWKAFGTTMIIYLAGLQTVDESLLEAGRIDGCTEWQLFRKIKLPLISSTVTINIILSVISGLKAFEDVYKRQSVSSSDSSDDSDIRTTSPMTLVDSDGNTIEINYILHKDYSCEYRGDDGMEYTDNGDETYTDENGNTYTALTVSYTHLDVYKRQDVQSVQKKQKNWRNSWKKKISHLL